MLSVGALYSSVVSLGCYYKLINTNAFHALMESGAEGAGSEPLKQKKFVLMTPLSSICALKRLS